MKYKSNLNSDSYFAFRAFVEGEAREPDVVGVDQGSADVEEERLPHGRLQSRARVQ